MDDVKKTVIVTNESNVVCKLQMTNSPLNLRDTLDKIIDSLVPRKNGTVDHQNMKNYTVTLLIEEAKKTT